MKICFMCYIEQRRFKPGAYLMGSCVNLFFLTPSLNQSVLLVLYTLLFQEV